MGSEMSPRSRALSSAKALVPEAKPNVVVGLDEKTATTSAEAFFSSFADRREAPDLAALPSSEALALLLDLDDGE